MNFKKQIFTIITLTILCLVAFVYFQFKSENWFLHKTCAVCDSMANEKMQRLVGFIKIQPNKEMLFTEQLTGKTYHLIPCDIKCDKHLSKWFQKIGFVDNETQKLLCFDIEGKLNTLKQEFILESVVLLGAEGE